MEMVTSEVGLSRFSEKYSEILYMTGTINLSGEFGLIEQSGKWYLANRGDIIHDNQTLNWELREGADPVGEIAPGGADTTLSDEQVEDIVGAFVSGSGATSVSYDDAAGTLTIESTDTDTQLDPGHTNPTYDSNEDGILDADVDTDSLSVNGAELFIQSTQPSNMSEGDVWIDTS